ncbi:MAG: hypothetical protein L0Y66_13425 [Myxococcaceae bacterium]|nr:hypothetical protein [Myxococcaceae bacterium]MCI0673196.1 hypothetical protein [Myxococcaceae bacterium]
MRPAHHSSRRIRGASLLTTLIVVGVLTLLVSAAVVFTGQERISAGQHMRREVLVACVQAARNFTVSKLRASFAQGLATDVRGEMDTGEFLMRTGHIDDTTPGGGAGVTEEEGDGRGVMVSLNMTNRIWGGAPAGEPGAGSGMGQLRVYQVVANCTDKQSRAQSEVEFQVRLAF